MEGDRLGQGNVEKERPDKHSKQWPSEGCVFARRTVRGQRDGAEGGEKKGQQWRSKGHRRPALTDYPEDISPAVRWRLRSKTGT